MKEGYVKIKAEHLLELYLATQWVVSRLSEEAEEELRPHLNAAKAALSKHDHIGLAEAIKDLDKDN